jgi:hypothetical protein
MTAYLKDVAALISITVFVASIAVMSEAARLID